MNNVKWLTVAALAILTAATLRQWYWVWGILFVYWGILGIRSGSAFVIEDISRAEHPALFWLINAMWTGFGVYYIYADLPLHLANL